MEACASLSFISLICIISNHFTHPEKYQTTTSNFPSSPPTGHHPHLNLNTNQKTEGAVGAVGPRVGTEVV